MNENVPKGSTTARFLSSTSSCNTTIINYAGKDVDLMRKENWTKNSHKKTITAETIVFESALNFVLMQIRILDPVWRKNESGSRSTKFTDFLSNKEFPILGSF